MFLLTFQLVMESLFNLEIFHCLPVVADVPRCSAKQAVWFEHHVDTRVLIWHHCQVTHLGNFGVPTIAIKDGKDSELVQH